MGAGASTGVAEVDLIDAGITFAAQGGKERKELSFVLKKYAKMRKAGVPLGACVQRAQLVDKISEEDITAFTDWCRGVGSNITRADISSVFTSTRPRGKPSMSGTMEVQRKEHAERVSASVMRHIRDMSRKGLPFGAISNMLRLKHNIDLSPDEVRQLVESDDR